MSFFKMTASPHMHSEENTHSIMLDVIIALLPLIGWGVFAFGERVLLVVGVSVIACVLSEFIYRKLLHKSNTIGDLSAVITGILLALTLPASVPLWICAIGGVFAIVVVKQLYGGLGKNVVNPALAARVFLFTAFPSYLSGSAFTKFGERLPLFGETDISAIAGATPLAIENLNEKGSVLDLFFGFHSGCIGEISEVLILLGGVYLLIRKVITWHIPVSILATVAVITFLFPQTGNGLEFMLAELTTGGLLLGAFFMATDYVTSPITSKGRIIFGIGCGLITIFIRYFGGYPEGISFAILIMNLLVWYIDLFTRPKVFGGVKNVKSKQ